MAASLLRWRKFSLVEVTAATVILVIDGRTNSTTVSTIPGTETVSYPTESIYTPLSTNEHGFPVTTVTILNQDAKPSPITVTFPTVIVDYDPSYTIGGAFQTTFLNGSSLCTTPDIVDPTATPWPSHPSYEISNLPTPTGLYLPEWVNTTIELLQLFPSVDLLQSCIPLGVLDPGPAAHVLTRVSYVTTTPPATYISMEPSTEAPPQHTPLPNQETTPHSDIALSPPLIPALSSLAPNPSALPEPSSVIVTVGSPFIAATAVPGPSFIVESWTAPLTFTFQGSSIIANPQSQFVVGGQTLVPGGPAITVSGTSVSLAPSASYIVVGPSTISLNPQYSGPNTGSPLLLTFDSQTLTANSLSQFTIAGQTLMLGGPAITVSGTRISLGPSASYAVIGSSTIPLVPQNSNTQSPVILIPGIQTLTANSRSLFTIAGQTLVPGGPAITVSGTRISLAPGGSAVVVGSSNETDAGATTTAGAGGTKTGSIAAVAKTAAKTAGTVRMRRIEVGVAGAGLLAAGLVVVCGFP
ncbi:MAG: hypothetical protein M1839_007703 [Geoglossum umbratile]|nr:MAG: hypothetical protein M1839_007703 [Geoglossum umbratile]